MFIIKKIKNRTKIRGLVFSSKFWFLICKNWNNKKYSDLVKPTHGK